MSGIGVGTDGWEATVAETGTGWTADVVGSGDSGCGRRRGRG